MEYVYDIVLNFQDNYYDFYEWQKTDKIINIKRLPIYKVSIKDYLNIKNNKVTIKRDSLPKADKVFLITSGIEILGLFIDNHGKVLKKSSLIFEESDDILEDKDNFKQIKIVYHIDEPIKQNNKGRIEIEKINYINEYIKKLDYKKDEYLLKYIYYDIYNEEEDDANKIYNHLRELSKKNVSKIYQSIKRINIELKK